MDADGDDQPDVINGEEFIDEVIGLDDASIYAPGATFWRFEVRHFSPHDPNWPFSPISPSDAVKPNAKGIATLDDQECSDEDCEGAGNSYVEERSRVFHEDIPIAGTDLTLHYASNRINNNKIVIHVPLSGETVPGSLKKIYTYIEYWNHFEWKYLEPLPNQKTTFEIEDHGYGKPFNVKVSIGFFFDGYYRRPLPGLTTNAFALFGSGPPLYRAIRPVILWKQHWIRINPPVSKNETLNPVSEGWTISNNHMINPSNPSVLYKGDGDKIEALESDYKYQKIDYENLVEDIAGNRTQGYSGDGGPATQAQLASPRIKGQVYG